MKTIEKRNGFTDLLRNYENATRQRNGKAETEKAYTTALQELAQACTFSVLKKHCNVGGYVDETKTATTDSAKTIRTLRQTLAKDLHTLDRLQNAINGSTAMEYNSDGDLIQVIKDKDLYSASHKLLNDCLGDGLDLINTAVMTILEETVKATDTSGNFMETPYTVRRLKRKVYIKDVDTINGYETTTTTAIQEVYKAIRREIENSRAMQIANNKYTYIDDTLKDTETDTEMEIYHRLPKYSGLAYETTDISGKITAITADVETKRTTDDIVAKLNLTAKQANILQLRLSGYGYKAIATYLGIGVTSVTSQLRNIKQKATDIGLTPTE